MHEALRGHRPAPAQPHAGRRHDGRPDRVGLGDPRKRLYAAQFIGQAFVTAYNLINANKDKIESVADAVIEKKEIYGDDLVRLLDAQNFVKPEIDWTDEETWPKIMDWSKTPRAAIRRSAARPDG